jgi:hypothetical protein
VSRCLLSCDDGRDEDAHGAGRARHQLLQVHGGQEPLRQAS